VNEIRSAESSGNKRPETLSGSLNTDLRITANMGENLMVAQLNKRKFNPIGMSAEIFECMKRLELTGAALKGYLAEKTKGFKHVSLIIISASAKFNCLCKGFTNVMGTSSPPSLFICDVILDSGARVDFKFTSIDRTTKTTIVLSCVGVISVILRIIDMFFRSVNSESFFSYLQINATSNMEYFEFVGGISKRHESENPNENTNSSNIESFCKCTDINSLRIIASIIRSCIKGR
jgi:hypothetical protein